MGYLLGEAIHSGLHTRIVAATDSRSGHPLALKMPASAAPIERTLDRLQHEYTMLHEAQGPGVVAVLEITSFGPGSALVMERWGQGSIHQLLQRGPLPLATTLSLGAALARALGRVHRKGIIHRDIKPHNVLVDAAQREIRLIDFGIAVRRSVYVSENAAPESLAGTLAYIAPEQTGRMSRSVDTRADLYALGATLYQMLTGALPFETNDLSELIHAHIAHTPIAAHERAPEQRIPALVSAIVAKLMAKNPEERYQTAEGVAFDLEQAGQAWAEVGWIAPFALGTKDWAERIRKPSRLFGREEETAALARAFERVSGGAVELVLVAGPSGVGKSALVQALRDSVRSGQGIFAPGKFDQLQRGTPYLGLSQALRSVVLRRLADPAEELAAWRAAWQEAAGPNGRILLDLMPELVHILGEARPLVEVGPIEARNRFQRTVQRFIKVIATAKHPLVLFLDDLQWADPASLVLLEELVTDCEAGHLLVVGAYRSDEVGPSHPLLERLAAIQHKGVPPQTLTLAPLGRRALAALVADMLDRPVDDELAALAQLVKDKTDGSPFFVEQFLRTLHEQKLLQRDLMTGRWLWQRELIERAGLTDNVATLLAHRLAELSAALQNVLHTAACIGSSFKRSLLTSLVDQPSDETNRALTEAVREGLLVLEEAVEQEGYAFVHDRVQQAAYESRPREERQKLHLRIGRELRQRYGAECPDDELFATLYHRNRAVELINKTEEQRDLCVQNLRAGQRAKASTAYAAAIEFLSVGQKLLGEAGFRDAQGLTFATHLGLAEVLTLVRGYEAGAPLFQLCLERAADDLERAYVASVWLPLLTITGQFAQGVEVGIKGLAWLGLVLPRAPEEHQLLFARALAELEPKVEAMTIADWKALPISTDRAHQLTCQLLQDLGICAAIGQPSLGACCWLIIQQSLRHGFTRNTSTGTGTTALALSFMLGKYSVARRLSDATLALTDQCDAWRGMAIGLAAQSSCYWTSLSRVRELYLQAESAAAEEGNISFEEIMASHARDIRLIAGTYLPQLVREEGERSYRDATALEFQRIFQLSTRALQHLPAQEGSETAQPAPDEMVGQAWSSPMTTFFAGAMASWTGLHLGQDEWALKTALRSEPLWPASWGQPSLLTLTMSLCIAAVHVRRASFAAEQPAWQEQFAFHAERLAKWAESGPQTFRHMRLLFEAGHARLNDRPDEAERIYDEAIEDAEKNGFLNDAALALRLAGEHAHLRGKKRLAKAYLTDAHDAYIRWGAPAAAANIRVKYSNFWAETPQLSGTRGSSTVSTTATTGTEVTTTTAGPMNARLDAASMLRAAQAISSDMVLDSLLGRMLRLLAQNAGAERAVLSLVQGQALMVEAELCIQPEQLSLARQEPVDKSARLPATLVQYAARSQEPVVLSQAVTDSRFDEDPYLRRQRPASVLAVPLVHQGRLSGVIYLEHARASNAFPKERVEFVSLLASQAATAVENARLYAQVQAASLELQRVNQGLESQVAARTDALQKALSELWSEMDLAQKIQTVLLPKDVRISGYDFAAIMRPAERVGGDYYDVFHRGAQDWVLIGDVSGHGVGAGLCMMMIQTAIRTAALTLEQAEQSLTPRRVLGLVDQAIQNNLQQIGRNQYMTITALCIEGGRVRYAGLHQDLLIYRASQNAVERIETQGIWLGVAEENISELLQDDELQLEAGDVLLLHTDGYTEAKVAELRLETEGLSQHFAKLCNRQLASTELIGGLFDALKEAEVQDDVTLVALRRLGEPTQTV